MYQNCNYNMNQMQLMHHINQISFMLDDLLLYLDTHPQDEEALSYFHHYHKLRKEAMKEYAEKYSPLTLDSASSNCDKWKWIYGKWPWEGGNC